MPPKNTEYHAIRSRGYQRGRKPAYLEEKSEKIGSKIGKNRFFLKYPKHGPGWFLAIFRAFDDHFFVLYGDAYLNIDYRKVMDYLKQIGYPALLTVYKNKGKFDKSNVAFINDKLVMYDKQNPTKEMKYIDYGLSILSKRIVKKY